MPGQVVCCDPDRAPGRTTDPARRGGRYRPGRGAIRHVVGRHRVRAAAQCQAARGTSAPRAAVDEPQGQVQQQLEAGESPRSAHSCPSDYLHKCSTTISQNHALVCIEDLRVRNLTTSATGTVELPGQHVRAKAGLNRAILDQGWFEFRRQLNYRLAWNGGWLIAVPPRNTSRTCPAAATSRRTTDGPGQRSPAWLAGSRSTLILSARSMYYGRGTPGSPVT